MGLHFTLSSAVSRNVMGYGGGEGELFSLWFGVFVVSGNYSSGGGCLQVGIFRSGFRRLGGSLGLLCSTLGLSLIHI